MRVSIEWSFIYYNYSPFRIFSFIQFEKFQSFFFYFFISFVHTEHISVGVLTIYKCECLGLCMNACYEFHIGRKMNEMKKKTHNKICVSSTQRVYACSCWQNIHTQITFLYIILELVERYKFYMICMSFGMKSERCFTYVCCVWLIATETLSHSV